MSKQRDSSLQSGKKLVIIGLILVCIALWHVIGPILGFAVDLIFGFFGTLLTLALVLIVWGIYRMQKGMKDGEIFKSDSSITIIQSKTQSSSDENINNDTNTIIKGDE